MMWNMLNDSIFLFGKEYSTETGSLLLGLIIAQAVCLAALAVRHAKARVARENREEEEDAARRLIKEFPEIAADPNVMTLRRTRKNGSQFMITPPEVAKEVHEYVGKLCGQIGDTLPTMIPAMISVARPVSQPSDKTDAPADAKRKGRRRK